MYTLSEKYFRDKFIERKRKKHEANVLFRVEDWAIKLQEYWKCQILCKNELSLTLNHICEWIIKIYGNDHCSF